MYEGNNPVGAARLRSIENEAAKIERVCILQDQRGKKTWCFNYEGNGETRHFMNKQKLKLHAQSYAIPFYEKLGYTVTSPEFMDAGIPHRAMEKEI